MADEVTTLKRELELLKIQLEQERKKNIAAVRESNAKLETRATQHRASLTHRDETVVQTCISSTSNESSRVYVQHVAVGARYGRWWLRDRQVLTRGIGGATLKVRETWVWSGRVVILDKIVLLDEKEERTIDLGQVQGQECEKDANVASAGPIKAKPVSSMYTQQSEKRAVVRGEAVASEATEAYQAPVKVDGEGLRGPTTTNTEDQ